MNESCVRASCLLVESMLDMLILTLTYVWGVGLDGKAEEAIATSDIDLNLESAPTLTGLALTLAGTLTHLTHN